MTRRSNNDGSVYQRKDGRWVGQITLNGKRKYNYSNTKREATAWINDMKKQIERGTSLIATEITLREYFEEWLKAESMHLKPKTFQDYKGVVVRHINPTLGKLKLNQVTPYAIQQLYNHKMESSQSKRIVCSIHAVLHHALNDAMKQDLIGRNPADAVTRPRYRPATFTALDANQVTCLLSHARNTRYEAMLYLAVTTGMRIGELMGLQWKHIDWDNHKIQVRQQLQRIKGEGLVFTDPKSRTSRRSISLGNVAMDMLRKQARQLEWERLLAGERWEDHDLVFPNTLGKPSERGNFYRAFKEMLKAANLPDIRVHDLRHTAATLMMQEGTHPKIVQSRLGHSQISLTMDTYSHVMPDMQNEIADKLDQLLAPAAIEIKENEKALKNDAEKDF
jgi:integrase